MTRWMLARAATGILLVWLVATASFVLISAAPGDVTLRLYDPRIPPEARERWRHEFGLDRPILQRYGAWMASVASGDLGSSWVYHRPVTRLMLDTLPNTVILATLGLVVELAGGVALALFQLRRPHGVGDRTISLTSLLAYALPTFAVSLGLIYVFAFKLDILPPSHMHSARGELASGFERLRDLLVHLVLPVGAIAITGVGGIARYLRGSLLDERLSMYVLAARARGCSERRAIFFHALPNALLPLVTLVGLSLPFIVSGSLVVEVIFSWPGMGRLLYSAAMGRDLPLLMGGTILLSAAVVIGNLLADLAYAAVDPRVRR